MTYLDPAPELHVLAPNDKTRAELLGRSQRTITRWRKSPPKPILDLLSTAEGRQLLAGWLRAAEDTARPAA